jgi:DNA gyrase/topoisomerase IV subunit B
MYKTRDGLVILEGLDAIRRRPQMYIGPAQPGRSPSQNLLELLVSAIADDTPSPKEVRVQLWRDATVTVAWDGAALPIEPFARGEGGVSHPALYQLFMYVYGNASPLGRFHFGAVLNALTERLVISTMSGGTRHRAVFAQGMLVSLLHSANCPDPPAINWLTFRLDTAIIGGEVLSWAGLECIVTPRSGQRFSLEDRSSEEADWF